LATLFERLAETLERTARLAEIHAEREQSRQRWDRVMIETGRAEQARLAALRARQLASGQRP
jgi:hypothetical protein